MTQYNVTEYDVDAVVVGAGIIGLPTAYHMKKQRPDDRILVIDMKSAAGQGNTAFSACMFRNFFSSPTTLKLVQTSTRFYEHLQNSQNLDLIKWIRYLWLFHEESYKRIEPVLEEMRKRGLEFELFDEDGLSKKLKINTRVSEDEEARMMGLRDVSKGILVKKAGSIDVERLVKVYESEFKELGGEIWYNTKAERIIVEPSQPLGIPGEPYFWQKKRAAGVETVKKGKKETIKAKKTIIAAGVWSPSLLDKVGIATHIKPIKRQLFVVKADTQELKELLNTEGLNPEDCMPFTILTDGSYIKPVPGEETFWLSHADEFPRAFELEDNPQGEEGFFTNYGLKYVVQKFFPQFEKAKLFNKFAGLYAKNTLDGQPVIFEKNDLIVATGASGRGIMIGDAVGRIAAALYTEEEYATLFGGEKFKVNDLGLGKDRKVEPERLII